VSPVMEYVVAAVLLSITLLAATTHFMPGLLRQVMYTYEGQLQVEAQKIVDQLLLSPGDPPDWGLSATYPDDVKALGLALAGGKPYELDPNKLVRIYECGLEDLSGLTLVSSRDMEEILGIHGRYAFSIRLTPVLNVSITKLSDQSYEVRVATSDGVPVPNAKVTGILVSAYLDDMDLDDAYDTVFYSETSYEAVSGYDGRAILRLQENSGDDTPIASLVVVYVDFYGIKTVAYYEEGVVTLGVILGNDLYVGHVEEFFNRTGKRGGGAIHLYPAAAVITPVSVEPLILSRCRLLPITPPGSARTYYRFTLEGLEDDAVMVAFLVKNRGEYRVAVAHKVYQALEIGSPNLSGSPVPRGVHIRRIVNVGGYLYYFDFTMWRTVEEG